MNWDVSTTSAAPAQRELFLALTPEEEKLLAILKQQGDCGIDLLCQESQLLPTKVASALLNLEFEGIVKCLPGKVFRFIS
jgi:DNA processing protein